MTKDEKHDDSLKRTLDSIIWTLGQYQPAGRVLDIGHWTAPAALLSQLQLCKHFYVTSSVADDDDDMVMIRIMMMFWR